MPNDYGAFEPSSLRKEQGIIANREFWRTNRGFYPAKTIVIAG